MIAELLLKGEENAITTYNLIELSGITSARELQGIIAEERKRGALILSTARNGGGYYLPDDGAKGVAEINGYIGTLKSRALNTLAVLKPAVKAAKAYNSTQQSLFGE